MTDEQRGMDPTVCLATKDEKRQFREAMREFLDDMKAGTKDGRPVRKLPNAERSVDESDCYPTWKIHVVDSATRKSTDLVVNRPFSDPPSMFGRATRAYIAYDLGARRLVFLKDSWRPDHPKLRAESKTYRELKMHNVPHIPNVLYGGDVRGSDRREQDTRTQELASVEEYWLAVTQHLERHVHHRIVQDIAYPLESALDVREFLQVLHDILLGERLSTMRMYAYVLLHRSLRS